MEEGTGSYITPAGVERLDSALWVTSVIVTVSGGMGDSLKLDPGRLNQVQMKEGCLREEPLGGAEDIGVRNLKGCGFMTRVIKWAEL